MTDLTMLITPKAVLQTATCRFVEVVVMCIPLGSIYEFVDKVIGNYLSALIRRMAALANP